MIFVDMLRFIWENMKNFVLPFIFTLLIGYAVFHSAIYLGQENPGMFFAWFLIATCNTFGLYSSINKGAI